MARIRKFTTASLTSAQIRWLRDIAVEAGKTDPRWEEMIVTCDIALSTRGAYPLAVIRAAQKTVVNALNANRARMSA